MIPTCSYCMTLLAHMRSAISEARAIEGDVRARVAAGAEINRNSAAWHLLASNRWKDAMLGLADHQTTHGLRPTLPMKAYN